MARSLASALSLACLALAVGGASLRAGFLDCSEDAGWSLFRERLRGASRDGHFALDEELAGAAFALVQAAEAQGGLVAGAERFYGDLCSGASQSFCLYGTANALFVVAASLHGFGGKERDADSVEHAQEYLRTAISLLGLQGCLDFMESTMWPIRANDILGNLNRSAHSPFALAALGVAALATAPPPGSSLHAWKSPEVVDSLIAVTPCSADVRVVAVGTHPTLTLEVVTMLRDFAFAPRRRMPVQRTLGIAYKCGVFPEMCSRAGASGGSKDPIAELIGPFDAPPPYESYTLARISATLAEVGRELRGQLDLLICTSPYVVCAVLQQATDAPLLGFFGLPLLWKRPTDLFDNVTAREEFWGLLSRLLARPDVVLAANNPLLSEQIAFQAPGALLPVVRPHALFTQAVYTPTHPKQAMLVSRTKFLWVTLGCVLRHFMPDTYPVAFTVANSDSKLPFTQMAAHRAAVLVPWEHALMAFFEFYSMAVPLLMPDAIWAYRLVFDADGNLGSTVAQYVDVSPQCDASKGCGMVKHPHPPFMFASLESRLYWYQYSSFAQFPHIHTFSSVPDMLQKVLVVDLEQTSASMKAFNDLTLVRSVAFWRRAVQTLFIGHQGCNLA